MASGGRPRLGSNYILGERVGFGAMGVVFSARSLHPRRSVAIKILHPHLSADDGIVGRFLQERKALGRVDHPNVVGVLDLVAEGDQLGVVMELVGGGDLRSLLKDRTLAVEEVLGLVADLADGLGAIHAAGIVHRDLKPANILLSQTDDGRWVPKISDFGVAKILVEAQPSVASSPSDSAGGSDSSQMLVSRSTAAVGTPRYMAPEAVDPSQGLTSQADIYSLGVVLFELVTGEPPFVGNSLEVLRAHLEDDAPGIEGVPTPLAALISEMLSKDPTKRPNSTDVVTRLNGLRAAIDPTFDPMVVRPESTKDSKPAIEGGAKADGPPSGAGNEAGSVLEQRPRGGAEVELQQPPAPVAADRTVADRAVAVDGGWGRPRRSTRRTAVALAACFALLIVASSVATRGMPGTDNRIFALASEVAGVDFLTTGFGSDEVALPAMPNERAAEGFDELLGAGTAPLEQSGVASNTALPSDVGDLVTVPDDDQSTTVTAPLSSSTTSETVQTSSLTTGTIIVQPEPDPVVSGLKADVSGLTVEITFTTSTCTSARYVDAINDLRHESPGWPDAASRCWTSHARAFAVEANTSYQVTIYLRNQAGDAFMAGPVTFTGPTDPASEELSIVALQIPNQKVGITRTFQLQALGGDTPREWSLLAHSVGTTISPTGLLTITPRASGAASVTVQVDDGTTIKAKALPYNVLEGPGTSTTSTSEPEPPGTTDPDATTTSPTTATSTSDGGTTSTTGPGPTTTSRTSTSRTGGSGITLGVG